MMYAPKVATGLRPGVEWPEDKVRMGMVLAQKGQLGFSPVSSPNPRHRLEAYATLTPWRRHSRWTAIASRMALGDRSDSPERQ
jgi:hypothetical protein